jgi:hypothetical protein
MVGTPPGGVHTVTGERARLGCWFWRLAETNLKKSFLKTSGENRRPTIRDCIGNAMLLRERVPRSAFD